jgi:uncharacterized protein (TIGR00255 family)
MLKSMTGYGRGESVAGNEKVVAEVRSVNHRFLDVSVKTSKILLPLEQNIKKTVSSYVSRGKVDVFIQFEPIENSEKNICLKKSVTKHVYELLQQLKKDTAVSGDIDLSTLLYFKDIIFEEEQKDLDVSGYWLSIKPPLEQALLSVKNMQNTEGEEISKDINSRLKSISEVIDEIEKIFPESLDSRQTSLKERIKKICEGIEINEDRMLQEIAIIADRSDITEELIRAKSHIKQFIDLLQFPDEPIGRKLEFLLQEINREVNTIGSKACDSEISLKAVVIKNELEKIREQVQNVM